MHRRPLIELLRRYRDLWPAERDQADRFLTFVSAHADCLHRHHAPGHVTASAWILAPDDGAALLLHHRKLGRWLQLGGHVDGEALVARAALREAREESGMASFGFVAWAGDEVLPIDLDVHAIPARGREPAHEHWDVRFLLRAAPGQALVLSGEGNDLRWFTAAELRTATDEDSVLRLHEKGLSLRGRPGFTRVLQID